MVEAPLVVEEDAPPVAVVELGFGTVELVKVVAPVGLTVLPPLPGVVVTTPLEPPVGNTVNEVVEQGHTVV